MKYEVALNGKIYEVDVTETDAAITSVRSASFAPAPAPVPAAAPAAQPAVNNAQAADGEKIVSPMPGNILAVNITVGQSVKAGDVLFVLEAMKMENDIVAPVDGTVKQIIASKGATVDTDEILAVI